jgi:hypothetical protein
MDKAQALPSCKYAKATPLCVVPMSIPIAILDGPSHGPWNFFGAALTDVGPLLMIWVEGVVRGTRSS